MHPRSSFLLVTFVVACSSTKALNTSTTDASTNTPPGTPIGPPAPVVWTSCNTKFDCGSVEVPVDYDQPAGPRISVAVMRAIADDTEHRIGSLLVNPGGPGIPMIEQLTKTYSQLRLGFPKLAARFDVVAFDWRGVGQSAGIHCVEEPFFESARAADLTLAPGSDLAPVRTLAQNLAQGCKDHADPTLMAHLDTDSAARDLERLRAALGDEKLTFIGFSYGTWLGAKYASIFPDKVRALALDSGVVSLGNLGDEVKRHAKSWDLGFSRFVDACAADAGCAFHGPEGATVIAQKFDDLTAKVRSGTVSAKGRVLTIVDFHLAVLASMRGGNWKDFAVDLAHAEAGDGAGLFIQADPAAGRRADATYDGSFAGGLAIGCLDTPFAAGTTLESFRDLLAGIGTRGAQAAAIPWALCVDWPWRRAGAGVPVSAPSSPPALFVSSRYDADTSYEQTTALQTALGNGSHLLTYEADGHAAALHSLCVRDVVSDFLIDPKTPPAKTMCAAE